MNYFRRALVVGFALPLVAVWLTAQTNPEREREVSSRVADLIKALDVQPGARVADVGAGDGFYTVRIAQAVAPMGRVAGVDISAKALTDMRARLARDGVTNVDVVLGAVDDPHLTAGTFDAILVHNAYHEMVAHEDMLKHMFQGLRAGGRLVMAESTRDSTRTLAREKQVEKHQISPDLAQRELEAAGFVIVERDDDFIKFLDDKDPGGFWLLIARKPPATAPTGAPKS